MNSEQWKLGGRCNQCRKQAYCGKECTAHKRRVTYEVKRYIYQKMDEKSHGVFSQIMEQKFAKEQE